MKANGEFFEGGESIERPMDLYPVYASLAANINVIAEGHELDPTSSDTNVREGVVQATVTAKDGKYELGINGLGAEGALPDGYRFLGWYEVELDEQGSPLLIRHTMVCFCTTKANGTTNRMSCRLRLRVPLCTNTGSSCPPTPRMSFPIPSI